MPSRVKRITMLALVYFCGDSLLDWRSFTRLNWGHIKHLSGFFDFATSLGIAVGAAILFGLLFDLVFFGWFLPRFSIKNSITSKNGSP